MLDMPRLIRAWKRVRLSLALSGRSISSRYTNRAIGGQEELDQVPQISDLMEDGRLLLCMCTYTVYFYVQESLTINHVMLNDFNMSLIDPGLPYKNNGYFPSHPGHQG